MKRARLDLETAISFLCARASKSDEDYCKKLRRVLAHVKGAIDDMRIIGADSLSKIYTWMNTACRVTADMKSQTSGVMPLGLGVLFGKITKQKLNMKSSTEVELA